MGTSHEPVLLQELIAVLDLRPNDTVVDATLGGGGHASALAGLLGEKGTFIGIDLDHASVEHAKEVLMDVKPSVHLVEDSFRNLDDILARLSIKEINAMVVDLGLSSDQLEQTDGSVGRGFSFKRDEPLVMTFKSKPAKEDTTAHDIVNKWDEEHLVDILFGFGEERFAKSIARHIVGTRDVQSIETTTQLVKVIEEAVPSWYRFRKLHPATRTFQALRMAVNDEVGALEEVLRKGMFALAPEGRFGVISFHSVEDRIVKHYFREQVEAVIGTLVHKKPITPTKEEINRNQRARSAKLRTFRKN
jgi:16S rRNA (cytosine1402-N4)-methyltransferase